jgi:hypothetical protein
MFFHLFLGFYFSNKEQFFSQKEKIFLNELNKEIIGLEIIANRVLA